MAHVVSVEGTENMQRDHPSAETTLYKEQKNMVNIFQNIIRY